MRSAVALALAVLALVVAGAAGARPLPSVRIVTAAPVQVRGAHFVSKEHVRVTLLAGGTTLVRSTVASAAGGFLVSFGTLSVHDRCSGTISVTVLGAHKDSAAEHLPSLACAPAGPGVSATYSS